MTRIYTKLAVLVVLGLACTAAAKPTKGYPFAVPPDAAIEKIVATDKARGPHLALSADEAKLFAHLRDGKFGEFNFAEAFLMASGVSDPVQRKSYLKKIDEIEASAKKELEGAKTTKEKGERLLKFLHAGPMSGGYELKQTDLHVLLDSGKFNCVSSAVLYNVIGRRLGLELKAVEIPEHVFAVLCDGDRKIDVETTNAMGFDPKDGKGRKASERREVAEAGLASIIAYNHGVGLTEEKQLFDAAVANFRALGFDPTNPNATKNALASLTNWPLDLASSGEYESALSVMAIGLQIAPAESTLKNNHKAVWAEYADSRVKAGKSNEAVAILRRAAKAGAGDDFENQQAFVFIGPAQDLMSSGKFDEALATIDAGLKIVDPKAQKKLRDVRVGVFLNWSIVELEREQFEKAVNVLKRAATEEKDSRIKSNTIAIYDSWANGHMKRGEWADAIKVYEKGLKQLPGDRHLAHNLSYCREQVKK